MRLVERLKKITDRLAQEDDGWVRLFHAHGLDIKHVDDEGLAQPLQIDRSCRGFEDFAAEAWRAIEPGKPCHSLLYHALASPNVTRAPGGAELKAFPTLAELETIENYIFSRRQVGVADL